MLTFGIWAATPLVVIGLTSRLAMARWRDHILASGKAAKAALGVLLLIIGVSIVSGFDKSLEAKLVALSPEWLTALTTRL